MAKQFFKEHNLAYTEHNVQEDMQAQQEMIAKSHQLGVPVIDVDGEIFVGYDKKGLSQVLKIGQ
jgi:glutaredoxin